MSRPRLYLQWMIAWIIILSASLPALPAGAAPLAPPAVLATPLAAVTGQPQAAAAPIPAAAAVAVAQQPTQQSVPAQQEVVGAAAPAVVVLDPTDDARTQSGSPSTNFDDGFLWMGHPNVHFTLLKFDLSVLPPDATVAAAGVRLDFLGVYTGTNDIEPGRIEGAWDEGTVTASTPLTYTWSGQFQTVTSAGLDDSSVITFNVTPLVQAWHSGALPNDGVALRGAGGELKAAYSKETGEASSRGPKLVIAYTLPADEGQPRPDLGDAPDSSNHHGINNTAYVAGGIPGQFPTVWDVPAGQPAGPRHANQTPEGWLGDFLSREAEADLGPDQDAPRNNILRNTVTGAVGDVADNDRGDDGWRNRTVKFFDCRRQTLDVRVSKAPAATRNILYLNVWFDGNRDGDWADLGQCQKDEDEPAQAAYEWIVQNFIVDMTSIPPGGSRDFAVLTEKVMNATPGLPHWMRFTLSEEPAVQPPTGGLPDGRGPHPGSPLGSYQHGETEDVFQKPAPAGTPGTLQILKQVITPGEPVEWIDYVTYEIRLRHAGGTEPLQVRMRDVLPYPLIVYPTISPNGIEYVQVASPTGGATPRQAQLEVIPPSGGTPPQQVVRWQGALAPNAEIIFTFQVRVLALCAPNQQTMIFTNTAQAKPEGGTALSAADTFVAKCIGYDEGGVEFTAEPFTPTLDLDHISDLSWRGTVRNTQPVSVTVGIYQQLPAGAAGATVSGATVSGAAGMDAEGANTAAGTAPLLTQITLGPNETRRLEANWRPASPWGKNVDELSLSDDPTAAAGLRFCLLPQGLDACPDSQLYPHLHGTIPFTLTLRPNDLGDAPDSSNHTAGAAGDMPAYPGGVLGAFPTVFDPATGQPQGPRHSFPGPLHLGQFVSREAEADVGPDQDPLNNILPAADDPDNDRGDDGPIFGSWLFGNCQQTVLQTRVAVTQQAVNYFQNLGTPAYLNVWIDANRDGDWADAATCGAQAAPEHILIDSPVNVVALGPGLHTVFSQTGLVPWPVVPQGAWVRVTLSERPSNKTLQAGNVAYGDGRGYPQPFKTGETEDFFFRPQTVGGGPDVAVQLHAASRNVAVAGPELQVAALDQLGNFEIQIFKVDYANVGTAGAVRGMLEFQIPAQLRGLPPAVVRGSDLPSSAISFNFDKVSIVLPALAPNAGGSVVLGWYGCITCTLAASGAAGAVDYTANVKVSVAGDIDSSNDQAGATARGLLSSPIIGAFMDYTDDACSDRVLFGPVATNQTAIALRGRAAPNSIIAILIGLVQVGTVTTDAAGSFSYAVTLPPGLHRIHAAYADQVKPAGAAIVSPRDAASGLPTGQVVIKVDPSLPFDPMSVCFVDSQGRAYAVPTLGYSFGATQTGSFVRAGETYQVSVHAAGSDLNDYYRVTFEDILLSSLQDGDGDGTYTGTATFPAALRPAGADVMQAAAGAVNTGTADAASGATNASATSRRLALVAGRGADERTYSTFVGSAADGVVSDRATGQPIANATVSALLAQEAGDGSLFYTPAAPHETGVSNPQVTGSDGRYSFGAAGGIYRLDAAAPGYQPYRSGDIDAGEAPLVQNIALSPVLVDAPARTIYITANGYVPPAVSVPPGSVVEFVNLDLADHSATGSAWDSGLLATGQGYKVKLGAAGTYGYGDDANGLNRGAITVAPGAGPQERIFLPVIRR